MKRLLTITMLLLFVVPAFAQVAENRNSWVAGVFNAAAYNYGRNNVPPIKVTVGFTGTGAQTFTASSGVVKLADGRAIPVFAINAPITIGQGSVLETVTPSAVSGCSSINTVCLVTASFTYAHGAGDLVRSGTAGLQEAVNDAAAQGGGQVVIDRQFTAGGGTSTMLTSTATAVTGVGVTDLRGTGPIFYGKTGTAYVAAFSIGAAVPTLPSGSILTAPVITTGLTASGSAANDFSASTGAFKTSSGAGTFGGSSNTFTGASPQLTLGVAGSVVGGLKLLNATSGSITLNPQTGALSTSVLTAPATTGTISTVVSSPCAAASASCTETVTNNVKQISGISGALNAASPSVAAVTFSTGYTSVSSYTCVASPNGNTAVIAAGGVAITYTSATVVTFTSANGLSNAISFRCTGT